MHCVLSSLLVLLLPAARPLTLLTLIGSMYAYSRLIEQLGGAPVLKQEQTSFIEKYEYEQEVRCSSLYSSVLSSFPHS